MAMGCLGRFGLDLAEQVHVLPARRQIVNNLHQLFTVHFVHIEAVE